MVSKWHMAWIIHQQFLYNIQSGHECFMKALPLLNLVGNRAFFLSHTHFLGSLFHPFFLLWKPWKTQNSWQKETPLDLLGYLQCWTIVTKIWNTSARSTETPALSQGITSEIANLSCPMDVAPVPHMPQGDTALHVWDIQHGISEMRKAKDGRLDLQPVRGFRGLSWMGKH